MSDRERLQALRQRKRLTELRALKAQQVVNPDVPTETNLEAFSVAGTQPQETLGQKVVGAGEAALATLTGATSGALGFGGGSVVGALGELTGQLEEGEGLEFASELGGALTFEPRTEFGQELISNVAKIAGVLPPILGTTPLGATSLRTRPSRLKSPKMKRLAIAQEIEAGNVNAGNIAKTLDVDGKLITNPNLKKAIKLMGDSDAAYSSAINFEKMNDATRFQVNKMLDTIQSNKSSGDPTQIMENRPANIIGRSLANRVKKLDSIKKEASSSIGKIINSDVGQKQINTNSIRDNFINALRESDIDVGLDADGNLIADTSRTLANTGEVLSDAKLNNILKRLQSGNMTAKDAHKLKRNVRELVSFDATAPGAVKVSAEIENTIKGLSSELNDEIGVISSAYKRANQKFSDSIDTLKEVDRMLGKRLMIGDELAENKLGALSKRIGTNLASREDVLAMVDSLDTSLNKRKVFPKDNIKQQVATLADLEKIFKVEGEQSPFGFQSRIAQGLTEGAQLATGAPASTQLIDAAITKFRSMNKLEFDDKMKALRALSKKRGK
jgi:hypothetical protein